MEIKLLCLSLILHIIAISCILGVVFYFIIQKSSYRVFSKMLINSLGNIFDSFPENIKGMLNNIAGLFSKDIIDALNNMTVQEPETTTANRKLFMYWNIFIGSMMVIFIICVIIFKAYQTHAFYIMLFETIVSFFIVGIIELSFFYLIALKYAPVYPSELEPLFVKAATEYINGNSDSAAQNIKDILSL